MRPGLALAYIGNAVKDIGSATDWATSTDQAHSAALRNRKSAIHARNAADELERAAAELREYAKIDPAGREGRP